MIMIITSVVGCLLISNNVITSIVIKNMSFFPALEVDSAVVTQTSSAKMESVFERIKVVGTIHSGPFWGFFEIVLYREGYLSGDMKSFLSKRGCVGICNQSFLLETKALQIKAQTY